VFIAHGCVSNTKRKHPVLFIAATVGPFVFSPDITARWVLALENTEYAAAPRVRNANAIFVGVS